jgi:hypothetical protein
MGAAADCEAIGVGFLGQPVNTLTTLAFLVIGIAVMIRRRDRMWIGAGLIATGIGSFLFHGPMPPGSEWAHDTTLAWLLALIGSSGTRWEAVSRTPALIVLGAAFGLVPVIADPVAVLLTGFAVISLLASDRSPATWGPLALVTAAAVYGRLGATGGPLCDPGALYQPHGVWHVLAAVAVGWWAIGAPAAQSTTSR